MLRDDPSPLEIAHGLLIAAIGEADPDKVKEILNQTPEAVQPMPGWSNSPFQALAGSMHSFRCSENQLLCMDLLLEHGADPNKGSGYQETAMYTLLKRACVPAVERMQQTGHLARFVNNGVKGGGMGHFICTSTHWRDLGARYPIDDFMRILLDAGLDPAKNVFDHDEKNPVLKHLLWSSPPQYGFPRPASMEDACLRVLQADPHTVIEPIFIVQAFRSGYKRAFSQLLERYQEQGLPMEAIQPLMTHSKDEEKANFDAWILEARNPDAGGNAPTEARRPRI